MIDERSCARDHTVSHQPNHTLSSFLMALRRSTRFIDGSIPVQALLYDDEELLASQDGVGIYDGQQKSPNHQSGIVYISTHRLFYIDTLNELDRSFTVDQSLVLQTEYYAGLFTSSPKVTLHLRRNSINQTDTAIANGGWVCDVCAFRNPAGLSPKAASICSLCGVPNSSVPSASKHISKSLPTSPSASPAPPSDTSIPCPACTFLNHPSLLSCEICSTPLPRRPAMKSAPTSRPESPNDDDDSNSTLVLKLSFRKGGDKPFYAVLKRSLKGKAWQVRQSVGNTSLNGVHEAGRDAISKIGISGILQSVQSSVQGEQDHLTDALQDLEALMAKAKDMVRLAAELNEKLTTASSITPSFASPASSTSVLPLPSATEPEEATFIRSSLSQLGLHMSNVPVTQDMMKDEREWMEELAKELAGVLQGTSGSTRTGIMKDRGIIALDDVWGGWNRARGVALIPPSTFLQVIPLLPIYTNPNIQTRTLNSGLTVLHTPPFSPAAFASRLAGFISLTAPQTTIDIAVEEGLSVSLVKEMVEAVEADGHVVRDDANAAIVGGGGVGGAQLKWWVNMFEGYMWDGHV